MSSTDHRISSNLFLLKELVIRDVRSRYAGSGLGLAWAFANPVLWMVLYTVVFAGILRVAIPARFATFPEFLMAGLLPWMAIQEGISRSASALSDNAAMVKKMVFPVETLILSIVLAALFNQVIALAVFAVYVALLGHLSLSWLALVLPALLLQAALTFGAGCLASTVTAFVRDAVHAVAILLTVFFFATPIVYPAELVPERFRPFLEANPVAHLTDWYRRAFTLHSWPEPASVLYLVLVCSALVLVGHAVFARARPHFADLI